MCGGGGAPKPIDPLKQAEADIRVLEQQYMLDQQRAAEEYERQRAQEEADRLKFGEDLSASRANTRSSIDQLFTQTGLDPMMYDDRIKAELDRLQAGITFGQDPRFSTDIGSTLLDQLRNEQIREYNRSINEFAPEGFARDIFGGSTDDAIIESILTEQFGEASDSILRARDRGTLNDQGFQYAMTNLEQQRRAAEARLQDMGGGVLEGYRQDLSGIANNARTGAGGWDFGDSYSPDIYRTQLDSRRDELSGLLEGDIRNAIGGEQFFNTDTLIQKGGIGQGAQNTGLGSQSGSLLKALEDRKTTEEEQRGLGTSGSF